jgi:predicted nucleotidyltransferase
MDDADLDFLTEGERTFLQELNARGVRYILVGMAAALLQGARGSTEDIDLWFEQIGDLRIGEAARSAGGFWATRMQPPRLGGALGDRFDVVTQMDGLPDFQAEYRNALDEVVGTVPVKVLPLARIIASKRAANRAKDAPALYALEAALKVIEALKATAPSGSGEPGSGDE